MLISDLGYISDVSGLIRTRVTGPSGSCLTPRHTWSQESESCTSCIGETPTLWFSWVIGGGNQIPPECVVRTLRPIIRNLLLLIFFCVTPPLVDYIAPRRSLGGVVLKRFGLDAELDNNSWPLVSDRFLCNVYGRRHLLRQARSAVRGVIGRILM